MMDDGNEALARFEYRLVGAAIVEALDRLAFRDALIRGLVEAIEEAADTIEILGARNNLCFAPPDEDVAELRAIAREATREIRDFDAAWSRCMPARREKIA